KESGRLRRELRRQQARSRGDLRRQRGAPDRDVMTEILILLAMPEKVRMQYFDHLRATFPDATVNLVDHHKKVGPHIGTADVLVTFGPMMHDDVLKAA